MTTKKKPESEFVNYEPGEPEDLKAKELAAQVKKWRHDERVESFKSFMFYTAWVVGILLVVGAIIFGINRWVHAANEESRRTQDFYNTCILNGDQVFAYDGNTVCFRGTVIPGIDAYNNDGKSTCLTNGGLVMGRYMGRRPRGVFGRQDMGRDYLYFCMQGKVLSVR